MVEKTILPCGLTIISECLPQFPSLSLSYTLKSGSRSETPATCGIHHLIEHMLFKGSRSYDLKQIADISDRLGGRLNAFTGKEITQFYTKALDHKATEALALLSDLVFHARFPATEFSKEQNVIIQEIKEADDTPDVHAFERFYERLFAGDALGYPISGREETVSAMKRDDVLAFWRETYRPENLLLAAAGNIEHARLVDMAGEFLLPFSARQPRPFAYSPAPRQWPVFAEANEGLKQVYILIGFPGIPVAASERYHFMVMNDILGAGMSSRLFQSIREEKGLAYTVNSFPDSFQDNGILMIYGVCEPEQLHPYLAAVAGEIRRLKTSGIDADELQRSKDHCQSSIVLGLERSTAKMRFHTNQELYFQRELTIPEIMAEIGRIRAADISEMFLRFFRAPDLSVYAYGCLPPGLASDAAPFLTLAIGD